MATKIDITGPREYEVSLGGDHVVWVQSNWTKDYQDIEWWIMAKWDDSLCVNHIPNLGDALQRAEEMLLAADTHADWKP